MKQAFDWTWVTNSLIAFLLLLPSFQAFAQRQIVAIDGSSTVFPLTEAVAEEFQIAKKGQTQVTVGISGTGGGFKKFCRGETDVQNASRPILSSEIANCKKNGIRFVELPVAFDALAVVVHPENTWANHMTVNELKKLWEPAAQGKIKTWSQIRKGWPETPVNLYGPGSDSGTFDYFTEAIVGTSKSSRGDFTASEDDNTIVQGVSRDRGGLGYFGFAYYIANKSRLKVMPIQDTGKTTSVTPSADTVKNGTYNPLSRPIFIYISEKSLSSKPHVQEFTEFYLKKVDKLAEEVKYVALPPSAYDLGLKRLNTKQFGTVFEGHSEVGVSVEELLKRAPK